jgi:hypothetical protein
VGETLLGRHVNQLVCTLMQGNVVFDEWPAAPIAGGSLLPSTPKKPDNGARWRRDPGNVG